MSLMQFGEPLLETARNIRSMRVRGAAAIGQEAAEALAAEVARYPGEEALWDHAVAAARELAKTRPTAVSLRNALNEVLRAMDEMPDDPVDAARGAAEGFAHEVERAQKAIAEETLPLIEERPRLLTHCHSTAVVNTIGHARDEGVDVSVVVTETRPWGQGVVTAKALRDRGVPVRYIVDSAMAWMVRSGSVDQAFVGADTVSRRGVLYNKVGTGHLALACRDAGLPMHSLAERYKFSLEDEVAVEERNPTEVDPEGHLPADVEVVNPVFDATPGDHLTGFVTDDGIVAAPDVPAFVDDHFGGKKRWI